MPKIDQIKQLREETGVSVSEVKKALEQSEGDSEKAKELLRTWGKNLAGKKASRETKSGLVESYVHPNAKTGVLLDIRCETDFVAKNPDFKNLAHEICLQIAAMDPSDEVSLMTQPWIRDASKTIKDLIEDAIGKIGEKIEVKKFVRYEI